MSSFSAKITEGAGRAAPDQPTFDDDELFAPPPVSVAPPPPPPAPPATDVAQTDVAQPGAGAAGEKTGAP